MRGLETRHLSSRVKGRAALTKSLRGLHRRAYRFATQRKCTHEDYLWALELCTALQVLISGDSKGKTHD